MRVSTRFTTLVLKKSTLSSQFPITLPTATVYTDQISNSNTENPYDTRKYGLNTSYVYTFEQTLRNHKMWTPKLRTYKWMWRTNSIYKINNINTRRTRFKCLSTKVSKVWARATGKWSANGIHWTMHLKNHSRLLRSFSWTGYLLLTYTRHQILAWNKIVLFPAFAHLPALSPCTVCAFYTMAVINAFRSYNWKNDQRFYQLSRVSTNTHLQCIWFFSHLPRNQNHIGTFCSSHTNNRFDSIVSRENSPRLILEINKI